MKPHPMLRFLGALLLSILLTACGGGGGGSGSAIPPPVQPAPPPLAYPIPAGLWTAPASALPAGGNYVYLQSDSGDYIGGGHTYLYTGKDSAIGLTTRGLAIDANVQGDQKWTGNFLLPSAAGTLQAGYFKGLTRAPFADPAVGGIDWSGEGRGCNTISGWVVIDKITLTAGAMTAIDLRFEQHCEGGTAALHGQIHWNAGDAAGAPGPQNPPPAGLWSPGTAFTPPAGNYVYLASDAGDYIGGGAAELYTAGNTTIAVTTNLTAAMHTAVGGIGGWTGDFYGMNTLSQLQPGYYGGLQRYPFNNAVKGGLDWSGNGRGCNTLTGWFVVDKVTYTMAALTAIDLRFEQHCEGGTPALHGVIHWVKPQGGA